MANQYIGDYAEDAVVRFSFNTVGEDKAPITLAGVSTQSHFVVAKDGTDMTLDASTITVSVDAGSVTGRHVVTVNMGNDADFTPGSDYDIRLAAGTVDSISVVGAVLRSWSCEKRTAVGVSVRDGAIDTDTFAADTLSSDTDIAAAVAAELDDGAAFTAIPNAVVEALGVTVVASGTPTTTSIQVENRYGLTNTQADNALILHLSSGVYSRITNIDTGTDTITISPALPTAPSATDKLVIFGQYLASL